MGLGARYRWFRELRSYTRCVDSQEFEIGQTDALRKVLLQGCPQRVSVLGRMNGSVCSSRCWLGRSRCIGTAVR